MRTAALSSVAEWIGVASILLLLSPCAALAEWVSLSWMQPAYSAPVDEFLIYKGPVAYSGEFVDTVFPEPDASGVYSVDVWIDEIDQGFSVFVWLTAASDFGESPPSNANLYPTPEPGAILQLVAGGVGLAFLNKQRMRKNRRPSRTKKNGPGV
jgi:hypothetical protein